MGRTLIDQVRKSYVRDAIEGTLVFAAGVLGGVVAFEVYYHDGFIEACSIGVAIGLAYVAGRIHAIRG